MTNFAFNTIELNDPFQCQVSEITFFFTDDIGSIKPEFNNMVNMIYTDLHLRFAYLLIALFLQKAAEATIGIQIVSQEDGAKLTGSIRINLDLDEEIQFFGKLENYSLQLMDLKDLLNAD